MESYPHLIPPWSTKKRLVTAVIMAGFILVTGWLIGSGIYQAQHPYTTSELSKEGLMALLLTDGDFLRTAIHTARTKECRNETLRFAARYEAPLHPVQTAGETACTQFVTIHPTGATITVTIAAVADTRASTVGKLSQQFSLIQTGLLTGTKYETSQLSGIEQGVSKTIYVIQTKPKESVVVTYSPTSPTVDPKVFFLATHLAFF